MSPTHIYCVSSPNVTKKRLVEYRLNCSQYIPSSTTWVDVTNTRARAKATFQA